MKRKCLKCGAMIVLLALSMLLMGCDCENEAAFYAANTLGLACFYALYRIVRHSMMEGW